MECEICGNQTSNKNKICDVCKTVKDIYENIGIDVTEALEKTKTDRENIKKINIYYLKKQYKEALEITTKYAEINADCALCLGRIYANENGIGIDKNKACHWYKVACSLGNRTAEYSLGKHYQTGKLFDQDLEEAFKWFESAAQHGHQEAMYEVGICYEEGKGIEKDEKKALEWYEKAYESGKKEAAFKTAYLFHCGSNSIKNYEKAAKYYQFAITNNSSYSISSYCNLANLYRDGQGVEQDIKKAVDYYNQSIEQGGTQAMLNLADLYKQGKLIERNLNKALQLYEKAEEKGRKEAKEKIEELKKMINEDISSIHKLKLQDIYNNIEELNKYMSLYLQGKYMEAMEKALEQVDDDPGFAFWIGCLYNDGKGVNQNFQMAKKWFEATERMIGDARAQYCLGKYYQIGRTVEKDQEKAFELFYISAHQGWADAAQALAECYNNGLGVEKNEELALAWYKKAIELGQKKSYFPIAIILHCGGEKVRNYQEAAKYYKLAIENSSFKAASYCNLATLYKEGLGVEQDWDMAIQYYQMGAEEGSSIAMMNLAQQYESGQHIKKDLTKALELYERAEQKSPEEKKLVILNKINSLRKTITTIN